MALGDLIQPTNAVLQRRRRDDDITDAGDPAAGQPRRRTVESLPGKLAPLLVRDILARERAVVGQPLTQRVARQPDLLRIALEFRETLSQPGPMIANNPSIPWTP